MMMVDAKRLNDGRRVWVHPETGEVIDVDRAWRVSDERMVASRRTQALMAAAGESPLPDRRWYVLAVVTDREISVDDDLRARGVETWLPIDIHKPKRRSSRTKTERRERGAVAFEGYVFVHIHPMARVMISLKETDCVLGVIGGWESPSPIVESDISALRNFVAMTPRERKRFEIEMRKHAIGIAEGDSVMIRKGVLSGFVLDVQRLGKDAAHGLLAGGMAATVPLANLLNQE